MTTCNKWSAAALMSAALLWLIAPAAAQSSMDAFFGNTLLMTLDSGAEIRMYIDPDYTYAGVSTDGSAFGGTWELKDGQACFTREPATHESVCDAYPGRQVGDVWDGTIVAGGMPITLTIVEGR